MWVCAAIFGLFSLFMKVTFVFCVFCGLEVSELCAIECLVFFALSVQGSLGHDGLPVPGEEEKIVCDLSPKGLGLGSALTPGAASSPGEQVEDSRERAFGGDLSSAHTALALGGGYALGHGIEDFGIQRAIDAAPLFGLGAALGFSGTRLTIRSLGLVGYRGFIRV